VCVRCCLCANAMQKRYAYFTKHTPRLSVVVRTLMVCVYIHTHTHTYTHTYIHTYTYTHTYTHTHIHTYIHYQMQPLTSSRDTFLKSINKLKAETKYGVLDMASVFKCVQDLVNKDLGNAPKPNNTVKPVYNSHSNKNKNKKNSNNNANSNPNKNKTSMVYDVWCMMYDVWCMMYDIWCMMYDVWCMMYDMWCMMYDVWCMMYDVWCMYDVAVNGSAKPVNNSSPKSNEKKQNKPNKQNKQNKQQKNNASDKNQKPQTQRRSRSSAAHAADPLYMVRVIFIYCRTSVIPFINCAVEDIAVSFTFLFLVNNFLHCLCSYSHWKNKIRTHHTTRACGCVWRIMALRCNSLDHMALLFVCSVYVMCVICDICDV